MSKQTHVELFIGLYQCKCVVSKWFCSS